jgi:hypothetical protein
MGTMDELIDADVVEQLRGIAAGRGQRGGARSDWPGLAEATSAVRDQRLRTRVDVVRDAS